MEATYTMRESRVAVLRTEVEELNRRAEKLGVAPLVLEILRTELREDPQGTMDKKDGVPTVRKLMVVDVRLAGETPRLAGWALRAVIEPHDAGNVLRSVPGHDGEIPEAYRQAKLWCDHCQTTRYRKETYVLSHADGRWAQVGSTCIKDFLGGADPHALAEWLEQVLKLYSTAAQGDPDGGFGCECRHELRWDAIDVLRATALAVRKWGWRSRTKAQEEGGLATADDVRGLLDPPKLSGKERTRILEIWAEFREEGDGATAKEALTWARALGADGRRLSDYEHNLKTLLTDETVDVRGLGLACSAIAAHARATEKELAFKRWAKIGENSQYQGEVGKRMELWAEVMSYRALEGQWGATHLYKLVDDAGNLYTWFGSKTLYDTNGCHPRLGDRVRVKATVKKHEAFRGVRQTVITRTSLLEIKEFEEVANEPQA